MADKGIKEKMRSFLGKYVKDGLADDQDFFARGLVCSLVAVEMILFMEQEFGITVGTEDLDLANFRSLNAIEAFVERKRDED